MGFEHRLTLVASVLVLSGSPLSGCSKEKEIEVEEKRRVLLTPQDLNAKRKAAREATRLFDAEGNCIASETKVAGVLLPRGMVQSHSVEHDWYFDGQLPIAKVEKYFREHLEIGSEKRVGAQVELFKSMPKDTPDAKPVYVRIIPKPGVDGEVRVRIVEQQPPPTRYPSPPEVEAEMRARGKFRE